MFSEFQSPYGDYLVRNKNPSENWPASALFQSPYGDYLVRNIALWFLGVIFTPIVSVPLRGLLS